MYGEIKKEADPKEEYELEEKSKHILASFQVMKEKFQHLLIKQSQVSLFKIFIKQYIDLISIYSNTHRRLNS